MIENWSDVLYCFGFALILIYLCIIRFRLSKVEKELERNGERIFQMAIMSGKLSISYASGNELSGISGELKATEFPEKLDNSLGKCGEIAQNSSKKRGRPKKIIK